MNTNSPTVGSGRRAQAAQGALDQVELADKLGYDHVWEVEHHFLEEYSHSSAPEVFLAAAVNARAAFAWGTASCRCRSGSITPHESLSASTRSTFLSDGRVDFGTGESSSEAELGVFNVDRTTKREQWTEALDAATRMMVEGPFAGYDGQFLKMPPRNVIPKRYQKPHPPLSVACSGPRHDPSRCHQRDRCIVVLVHRTRRGEDVGRGLLRHDRVRRMRSRRLRC